MPISLVRQQETKPESYKIAFSNVGADEAFEAGEFETAEELYRRAITEIGVYRENISEARDRAELDQEDRQNLESLEAELENLENELKNSSVH